MVLQPNHLEKGRKLHTLTTLRTNAWTSANLNSLLITRNFDITVFVVIDVFTTLHAKEILHIIHCNILFIAFLYLTNQQCLDTLSWFSKNLDLKGSFVICVTFFKHTFVSTAVLLLLKIERCNNSIITYLSYGGTVFPQICRMDSLWKFEVTLTPWDFKTPGRSDNIHSCKIRNVSIWIFLVWEGMFMKKINSYYTTLIQKCYSL